VSQTQKASQDVPCVLPCVHKTWRPRANPGCACLPATSQMQQQCPPTNASLLSGPVLLLLPQGRWPHLERWFDAMEARPAYAGFKSDYYTHCHDLPPQLGGCASGQSISPPLPLSRWLQRGLLVQTGGCGYYRWTVSKRPAT
jgi:hypothetical protein